MALVLISHDLGMVSEMTDRVAVMYCGRVVEDTPTDDLFDHPAHPYTRGLIAALPSLDGPRQRLVAIAGTVPPPGNLPPGCAFAPRCTIADARCAHRRAAIARRPARMHGIAPPANACDVVAPAAMSQASRVERLVETV